MGHLSTFWPVRSADELHSGNVTGFRSSFRLFVVNSVTSIAWFTRMSRKIWVVPWSANGFPAGRLGLPWPIQLFAVMVLPQNCCRRTLAGE